MNMPKHRKLISLKYRSETWRMYFRRKATGVVGTKLYYVHKAKQCFE